MVLVRKTKQNRRQGRKVSRQLKKQNITDAVKAQLAQLMSGNDFKNILGDTIAGVSTEEILAQTRALIWG